MYTAPFAISLEAQNQSLSIRVQRSSEEFGTLDISSSGSIIRRAIDAESVMSINITYGHK